MPTDTPPAPRSTGRARRSDGFFERGDQVTRLEAFVDAAFAFAVTLLAISIDSVPGNREELILALKGVPAFACSFAVICLFWWNHNVWSRRYGLDDGVSTFISLTFVALVLVYVYPLKSMFSSMWAWLSGDFLPTTYQIRTVEDLQWMFGFYAVTFISLESMLALLDYRAWRLRESIGLDAIERLAVRREMYGHGLTLLVGLASLGASWLIGTGLPNWALSLPGVMYFLLAGNAFISIHFQRRIDRLHAELDERSAAMMAAVEFTPTPGPGSA